MSWSKTTTAKATRHSNDCAMVFGRKDPSCPRCQELLAGAAPVKWNIKPVQAYYVALSEELLRLMAEA